MQPSDGVFYVTVECETCGHRAHAADMWRLRLAGHDGPRSYTCRDWSECDRRRRRSRGVRWSDGSMHLFGPAVGLAGAGA